ncbi:hypothetical protein Bca101_052983 [Brassica carinata]
MASVLSEINESLVEYATPTPPPPPPRETPTPPPRETPTTPKKLKLPPVDLNKNPVEEEEFGGKEVRVAQPEILLRCKEKTETYGKPRPRSSVLGNHDYRGDVEAQLSHVLRAWDNRWVCMRSFVVNAEIVEFLFIDTTPFVDKYFVQPNKHVYDWRGVLPRPRYLNNLLKEVDVALKESTAKWKIVIGHHTVKSAGHHRNTIELEKQLLPILHALATIRVSVPNVDDEQVIEITVQSLSENLGSLKEKIAACSEAAYQYEDTALLFISPRARHSDRSDASDHRYKEGDTVPLYANKVGPFHNPSETYRYFDLPFCVPEGVKEKKEALGEVLNGDRLVSAPYKLNFRDEKDSEVYCKKKLSKEEVKLFRQAVEKDYYFQMYYDDLPIWGFIGKVDKDAKSDPSEYKYFLYKHIEFEILYNKDRVIEISARMDPHSLVDLTEDKEVDAEFMYTVKWKETETPFEKRMEKYSMSSSLPHHLEIHWFSIINSCVTVLLLTGFLATILMRVLKNDFTKYAQDEEAADDLEETGWKYIHGDVFRFPTHNSLFAASLGSGTQLFTLTIFIFMLALVGVFYPYNRGALFTALVVIYALTSGIAGYTSASFYCQLEGKSWVRNLLLTGCLFCGPLLLTFCFLNTVAITYTATAALPFGTIVVIVLIWTLVTSPLLVLGGIAGKNSKAEFQAPCRTTKYPREIPPLPWYRSAVPQMAMAGFLPFSAIYIELYYIFASVWGHRIYTIYSILFIVFIILIIVTAFITVALTYFQLAAEDHQWWWRSFLCGGSTGLFIYAYCLYYYYARSDMSGFMQTSFFFGYMACICYGFFLMLGTVGFRAALFFVRHIYRSIKCE